MEITIGVSGDKGSSRQQIHSPRQKYLKLSGARGILQLRCVADVPQEGWLETGMWVSRKTGNTELCWLFSPAGTARVSWVCLSVSPLQGGASIRTSLHMVHLLWEQGKEKPLAFKKCEWEKCQGCGDQDLRGLHCAVWCVHRHLCVQGRAGLTCSCLSTERSSSKLCKVHDLQMSQSNFIL